MSLSWGKSILKPSESTMVALATGGLVYGVYQLQMPPVTEVHGAMPHNGSVDSSRKKAMWTSAAIVGGAFLLTKDATVFSVGAGMFLAMEWSYRHANSVHPATGKVMPYSSGTMNVEYTPDSEMTDMQNDDYSYGENY